MTTVRTYALIGLHAVPVDFYVTEHRDALTISGLPEHRARDLAVRVASALASLAVRPQVSIRFAGDPPPATYDLAVAVAILAHRGLVPGDSIDGLFTAELALDGHLRPVRGTYALIRDMRGWAGDGRAGWRRVVAPEDAATAAEASGVLQVVAPATLGELVEYLNGTRGLRVASPAVVEPPQPRDWRTELKHAVAPETIEAVVSAAKARVSVTLVGPTGAGKMLLARLYHQVMADFESETLREDAARIHSVAGTLRDTLTGRPFRAPHHSVSEIGLIGGGSEPRPGEVSLAHGGVLMLDEVTEFRQSALDALRRVLGTGLAVLPRASGRTGDCVGFPARPCVVATTTGCPCGRRECRCGPEQLARWRTRLDAAQFGRVIEINPVVRASEARP